MSAKQTCGKIPYCSNKGGPTFATRWWGDSLLPTEIAGGGHLNYPGARMRSFCIFALLLCCVTKNRTDNCASDQITPGTYILCQN